jgi:dihydrodipicolinate synthase/N-acetylneuraminate lyase
MPTPLTIEQSPDFAGLDACVRFYRDAGLGGVTVLGSGGELAYFSAVEQRQILQQVRESAGHDLQIITGIHAFGSQQALEKIDALQGLADAVLVLLDTYYRVPFTEYAQALGEIASRSPIPVLLYYFPQITGQYLSAAQLIELLQLPNIIGIKDSALHLPTARQLLRQLPDTLYFTGLSLMLKDLQPIRPCGAICPISALAPRQALGYQQALETGDDSTAGRFYLQLQRWLPVIGNPKLSGRAQDRLLTTLSRSPIPLLRSVTASQAACKEGLRQLGLPIGVTVKSPLPPLDENARSAVQAALS